MLSNNTYYNSNLNTLPSPPQQHTENKMSREQQKYCGAMMRNLKKHRDASPFLKPVDYVKLNVPDYPNIVTKPMDLLLVDSKLNSFQYGTVEEFVSDVRLIFNNCFKYNGPEAMISVLCQNVESAFEKGLRQMPMIDNSNNSNKETSPPLSSHHSSPQPVDLCSEDLGRPKREIHCPSKDYPETYTKQTKISLTNKGEMKYCLQVLRELKKNKYRNQMYAFMTPVDPIALNLPDYTTIVKQPMDMSTIENKLLNDEYNSPDQFQQDISLMFNNCFLYNPPSLPIYSMAKEMEALFIEKWAQRPNTTTIVKKLQKQSKRKLSEQTVAVEVQENVDEEIAQLERTIKSISKQIQSMKTKKSTPKKRVRSKPTTAPSTSTTHTTTTYTTHTHTPTTTTTTTPTTTTPTQKSSFVKKKTNNNNKNNNNNPTILYEFTFDEKKALSHEINELDNNRLTAVVEIIRNSMPDLDVNDQREIELDIDSLDNLTLHQLYNAIHPNSPKKHNNGKRQKLDYSVKSTDKKVVNNDSSDSSSSEEDESGSSDSDSDSD